jgi:predicted DNA-binding protein (MmcQ/YjbR family)
MNRSHFNEFCSSLPATTHVVHWGSADVWKIGGKIFAVGPRWGKENLDLDVKVSFKCSDFSYSLLIEEQGIIPAPYLARAKWVQIEAAGALDDEEIGNYLCAAYEIIVLKLTKRIRQELGI